MLGGGACLAAQLGCAQHWGPLLLGPCAAQPCGMLLLCKDDRTLADCVAGERACWEEGAWPLCSTALWHAAVVLTLQAVGRM